MLNEQPIGKMIAMFLFGLLVAGNIYIVVMTCLINIDIGRLKSNDKILANSINTISQQVTQITGGQIKGPILEIKGETQPNDYAPIN